MAIPTQTPDRRPPPEPQPAGSDGQPADARRRFLWLGGCSTGFGATSVTLADDGQRLAIATRGIPYWFAYACLALPGAAMIGAFVSILVNDGRWNPISLVVIAAFVMSPLAALFCLAFIHWLNQQAGDGVVRAAPDRAAQTLEVCDYGVTLNARHVNELIVVRGWQTKRDEDGTGSTWAAEMSVVGRTPAGEAWRWHVITTGHRPRLDRFADEVARVLGVPLARHRASGYVDECK